jgi:hypothetical protein
MQVPIVRRNPFKPPVFFSPFPSILEGLAHETRPDASRKEAGKSTRKYAADFVYDRLR